MGTYLSEVRYPGAAITMRASETYSTLTDEHNLVQMISRILYHSLLQSFSIDCNGRQRLDVLDFELNRDRVFKFASK